MKRSILVIDDNKAIRFLLQTTFNKKYQVFTAANGYSAMHWLTKKNLPDLIVADATLPDMREWELIEYLTSSRLYGNIPLIVLSDVAKDDTQHICKELGVKQFFLKPFDPLDLVVAVDGLVSAKKKIQESFLKLV